MQVRVRGDIMMMVQCRASIVMSSAIGQWRRNRFCDRAWVDVCSRYGWYYMHEKLVQGVVATFYGKLLVQWGVACMFARSREHMTRRGVGRWWAATCLNRKWAHLCKLAGEARGAWE